MGRHRENEVSDYWKQTQYTPCHYNLTSHIGKERFQQIERYLHISPSKIRLESVRQAPFEKIEPFDGHLRQKFQKFRLIGKHLSVDETIQRFMGRSAEIVNIPSKPTPGGFKIWVLANQGYILDWLHHAKGEGPWDLDSFFYQRARIFKYPSGSP